MRLLDRPRWQLAAAFAVLLAAIWLAAGRVAATSRAEQQWRDIRATGWLGFGIDPGVAPYSFYDASGWSGLDADVARAVCRELALRCASEPVGYDAMYDALRTRRVEAGISAWVADGTAGDIRFSRPYFVASMGIAVRRGTSIPLGTDTRAWLRDKQVAVQFGGDGDALARRLQREQIGIMPVVERTLEAAVTRARNGDADGVVLSNVDALRLAPDMTLYVIEAESFVIAVSAGNTRLLEEINAALERIERSGELSEINRRWLGPR